MKDTEKSSRNTYEAHRSGLLRGARRLLHSEADAEDVVQEVMLFALRAPDALGFVDDLGAWLWTVVRRRCLDLMRRSRRTTGDEDRLASELFPGADPQQLAQEEELCRAVAEAIEQLPEPMRWALVENALEGTSFREMAERTGIPMGTLMARKKRALDQVRQRLRRQGWLPEDGPESKGE